MPGKFELVKDRPYLKTYSDGDIRINLRRVDGLDGPVDIDISTLKAGGPEYHVAVTEDGYSVTVDPGFPMSALRPKRIDAAIQRLLDAKAGIAAIEDLLRELFPDTPVADRP